MPWFQTYKRIKLSEAFEDWADGGGIFAYLTNSPWNYQGASFLDFDYFGNHSGDKPISPVVNKLLVDGVLTQAGLEKLAGIVKLKFYPIWEKYLVTYTKEYDPLNNYSMSEEYEGESEGTDTTDEDTTDSRTRSDTIIGSNSSQYSESASNARYGFNSTQAVPTDTSSRQGTGSGSDNTAESETISDTGTKDGEYGHTKSESFSRTKVGSSGINSYQDLLEKERKLLAESFFEKVYRDLDTLLTLPIYTPDSILHPAYLPLYPNT